MEKSSQKNWKTNQTMQLQLKFSPPSPTTCSATIIRCIFASQKAASRQAWKSSNLGNFQLFPFFVIWAIKAIRGVMEGRSHRQNFQQCSISFHFPLKSYPATPCLCQQCQGSQGTRQSPFLKSINLYNRNVRNNIKVVLSNMLSLSWDQTYIFKKITKPWL